MLKTPKISQIKQNQSRGQWPAQYRQQSTVFTTPCAKMELQRVAKKSQTIKPTSLNTISYSGLLEKACQRSLTVWRRLTFPLISTFGSTERGCVNRYQVSYEFHAQPNMDQRSRSSAKTSRTQGLPKNRLALIFFCALVIFNKVFVERRSFGTSNI